MKELTIKTLIKFLPHIFTLILLLFYSESSLANINDTAVNAQVNSTSESEHSIRTIIIFSGIIYIFIAMFVLRQWRNRTANDNLSSEQSENTDDLAESNKSTQEKDNLTDGQKKFVNTIDDIVSSPGFKKIGDLINGYRNNNNSNQRYNRSHSGGFNNPNYYNNQPKMTPDQSKLFFSIVAAAIIVFVTAFTA